MATLGQPLIDDLPVNNDLTVITAVTHHYIASESTSTPNHHEYEYFHVPFFFWVIVAMVIWFIMRRLIIEFLIRFRK